MISLNRCLLILCLFTLHIGCSSEPDQNIGDFSAKEMISEEKIDKDVQLPTEKTPVKKVVAKPKAEKAKAEKAKGTEDLLNPDWIEKRIMTVGIDKLLEEYSGSKNKNVMTIKAALVLSAHILRLEPTAARSQLQARLVGRTEPALKAFQEFPKDRPSLRSEWKTLYQPGGSLVRKLVAPVGTYDNGRISSIAMTPHGKTAITVNDTQDKIHFWNLTSGKLLKSLEVKVGRKGFVSMTSDAKRAIFADFKKNIHVVDLETGSNFSLKGHDENISCLAISADGKRAISGSDDMTIIVWDLEKRKKIVRFKKHVSTIRCLALSADGKRVISASRMSGSTTKVWNTDTGKIEFELNVPEDYSVDCLAITPDGSKAISGSLFNVLIIWDLKKKKLDKVLKGHTKDVISVAISADGKRGISGSDDETIRVWDLESGKEEMLLTGSSDNVKSIALSANGQRAISSSEYTNRLLVWDLNRDTTKNPLTGHLAHLLSVNTTPDGKLAVTSSKDKTHKLWEVDSGKVLKTFSRKYGVAEHAFISPDGKNVFSNSMWQGYLVFDTESEKGKKVIHDSISSHIAMTLDGKYILATIKGKKIRVFNSVTGRTIRDITGLTNDYRQLTATPDNKYVIAIENKTLMTVWEIETGKKVRSVELKKPFYQLSIASDEKRMISITSKGNLSLWNLETWKVEREMNVLPKKFVFFFFCKIEISPDGKYALTAIQNLETGTYNHGIINVWNLNTGKKILTYPIDDDIEDWAILPDGKTILAAGKSGSLHKFKLHLPE